VPVRGKNCRTHVHDIQVVGICGKSGANFSLSLQQSAAQDQIPRKCAAGFGIIGGKLDRLACISLHRPQGLVEVSAEMGGVVAQPCAYGVCRCVIGIEFNRFGCLVNAGKNRLLSEDCPCFDREQIMFIGGEARGWPSL
jgi:hypothetical protein